MKTLIELYDERPFENVLGTEVFHPERTVFLCPPDVGENAAMQKNLRAYFSRRGIQSDLIFITENLVNTKKVAQTILDICKKYPECGLDITGGTDAALFAGGMASSQANLPVFTYSRRRNMFFNIQNAEFAEGLPCNLSLSVEDCFRMAGGAVKRGRVDNKILKNYGQEIECLYRVFSEYKREWNHLVSYIQRISQSQEGTGSLLAEGAYTVKAGAGKRISACVPALLKLEKEGLIRNLNVRGQESVRFDFKDIQVRQWLRDVGSVLELKVYKACLETKAFDDVRTSVIVDWEGDCRPENVTNEIDVMASCGVRPVFISCKVCEAKTEALNELAILRDRFGGYMARAAIVTAQRGNARMRHRAEELDIDVIDWEDLYRGRLPERLNALSR